MTAFDFRTHQARSRRSSNLVVFLFALMVLVIGSIVGAGAGFWMGGGNGSRTLSGLPPFDPVVGAYAVAGTMAVIILTAVFKAWSLGGDGAKVALSLGAEEVDPATSNQYLRRYLNVVDEMSIAANLPRPRVFVLKHEQGINAFAAGTSPEKGAVAMTHGALSKLTREEIAGVVAHEMAHIANRDTRLNTRLVAMVFGLVALMTVGRVVMRSVAMSPRNRSSYKNNRGGVLAMLAVGVALMVLGFLGMIGGRILQAAISRRREFLADATAVQLTRNPTGLAGALRKIRATSAGSRVGNAHTEETRHMFFSSVGASSFAGLMSTHPPIDERILALQPDFDPAEDLGVDDRQAMRSSRAEAAGPWGSIRTER